MRTDLIRPSARDNLEVLMVKVVHDVVQSLEYKLDIAGLSQRLLVTLLVTTRLASPVACISVSLDGPCEFSVELLFVVASV